MMKPYEAPQTPLEQSSRKAWPWWITSTLGNCPTRAEAVYSGNGMLFMTFIYNLLNLLNVFIIDFTDSITIISALMLAMTIPYTIWHWCAIWWVDRHQGWPQS
jgi:hypothetical protein